MILYYSGTGNSAYIARKLARELGDELLSVRDRIKNGDTGGVTADRLIFCVPTYGWRIPRIVEKWIDETQFDGNVPAWFVMSCGDGLGNAAKYIKKLCERKRFRYMGTAQIIMPENYIALFDAPEEDKAREIIASGAGQIAETARMIGAGETLPGVPVKLMDRIYSTVVNPVFYRFIVKADKFRADDKCVGCGKCVSECPLNDIRLVDGRPVWGDNCTHCMACICGCPTGAIEYGKASLGKPRYMCPED